MRPANTNVGQLRKRQPVGSVLSSLIPRDSGRHRIPSCIALCTSFEWTLVTRFCGPSPADSGESGGAGRSGPARGAGGTQAGSQSAGGEAMFQNVGDTVTNSMPAWVTPLG